MTNPLQPYRSTEWSIWSCFIHYDRLYGLIKHLVYNLDNCRFIDFYVDMNSLLSQIFIKNYKIFDYNGLTSALINLAIHYKDFFRDRFRINIRVFIVYSNNFPEAPRRLVAEYNHRNYLTYVNNGELVNLINHNRELLDLICKYLDEIYFIQDEDRETAVIIKEIITDQAKYKHNALSQKSDNFSYYPNIILTKDLYDYQLVAIDSYTFILRPRKIDGEDKSWFVHKTNLYKAIKKELGGNVNNVPSNFGDISPGLLPLFFSIAGLKSRNIKSIHTYNKTLEILTTAIKNNTILNGYNSDPDYCVEALGAISPKIAENATDIINRYNAIDIVKNHALYSMTPSAMRAKASIIDLISPINIRKINEEFFAENPININRLFG